MQLEGSFTALVTPFTQSGDIDQAALAALVEWQIASGTDGLVAAGSTGEAAAMAAGEFESVIATVVDAAAGRVPVLAGTGLSGTTLTLERTRRAAALGVDAALVVTPPYVRAPQRGLEAHYNALADSGELPIVLYNVPSRTGCDLLPATVGRLAAHPRIVALKEANVVAGRLAALLEVVGASLSIMSGDDATAADWVRAGASGVVSVASNAAPAAMHQLMALSAGARTGGGGRAEPSKSGAALALRLAELFDFCGIESNPMPIKALLAASGRIENTLRLPLVALSSQYHARLAALAASIATLEVDSMATRPR